MKRTLILIQFICLFPILANADVPFFDVVKLRIGDSIVYMRFQSNGILKNGDFCYYNYQDEYLYEVKDVVYRILKDPVNYSFFKELHKINVTNIPEIFDYAERILYVFKEEVKINPIHDYDHVEILSAENGNVYGYTYSENLSEKDNEWLMKYKFEKLFEFDHGVLCHMNLFAIEGTVSGQKKHALRELIEKVSKDGYEKLQEELRKLYKQKIIMLGFCSC